MSFFVPRFTLAPARCHAAPATASRRDFLSLLDETLNEINNVAASRQQQQQQHHYRPQHCQPLVNHRFDVRETENDYQVDGELPGFEQQDIEIEFTDDQTLVIKGNSEQQQQQHQQHQISEPTTPALKNIEAPAAATNEDHDASPVSDTASVKSHQATVEDDFEDLGEETPSSPSSTAMTKEKEQPVEAPKAAPQQPQQQQQPRSNRLIGERRFGAFSRTFTFPVRLSTEAATASLKNGVLSLKVPKAPVPQARRIQIA